MQNHLLKCDYTPDKVKKKIHADKGMLDSDDESGDQGSSCTFSSQETGKRTSATSMPCKKQKVFTVIAAKAAALSPSMQVDFENQLLRACISAGWSFHSIHDPEVCKLFKLIAPGAVVPDRKKLSNSILNREVVKIEGSLKAAVKGHYATLQADGWKDISRKHLVAFMITVNRRVRSMSLFSESHSWLHKGTSDTCL